MQVSCQLIFNISRKDSVCSDVHKSEKLTVFLLWFFFFQAEDGIRDYKVTGVQTCALPILSMTGMPSVIQTINPMPALAASIIASAAPEGGTNIQLASASVVAFASATVSKTGKPSTSVPPLPGVTPPTRFVPAAFILRV